MALCGLGFNNLALCQLPAGALRLGRLVPSPFGTRLNKPTLIGKTMLNVVLDIGLLRLLFSVYESFLIPFETLASPIPFVNPSVTYFTVSIVMQGVFLLIIDNPRYNKTGCVVHST